MEINGDEKINLENIGGFMYQKCLDKLLLVKDTDKLYCKISVVTTIDSSLAEYLYFERLR